MKGTLIIAIFFVTTAWAQKMELTADKMFLTNKEGNPVSDEAYDDCWCYPVSKSDTVNSIEYLKPIVFPLPVARNGMWGAIDKEGKKVLDFASADPVLITSKGHVKIKELDYSNYEFSASENTHLSVLDSSGIEIKKYHVADIYKGTFIASEDEKNWGLLSSEMKELTKMNHTPAHHDGEQFHFSSKGYWSTRENAAGSLFGAYNYKGKTIIPFKWKLISYVIEDEDHIYAMNNYLKRGYINIKGQTTLSFIYEKIPRVLTDSNLVKTEKYLYFLDQNLKQLGPKYQAFEKKGNLWFYKRDGKWGIMDINHKVIIPHQYSSIMDGPRIKGNKDFRCYIVVKYGKYGLIDLEGNEIIKPTQPCLCGLGYYAPADYYIEFQSEAGTSYYYNEKGELLKKEGGSKSVCFCE